MLFQPMPLAVSPRDGGFEPLALYLRTEHNVRLKSLVIILRPIKNVRKRTKRTDYLFNERGQTAVPHKPFLVESHRNSSARVRILLADDFAPWRSEVRSFVRCQTDWDIVFEAGDGLGAVQKIAELQPDVVVMDLNMPGLNGVAATRRIRQLSPDCIIIILTQYADEDLTAAALSAGAVAYVLKSEMTSELIPAVLLALRKLG